MSPPLLLALHGCVITRSADGNVELVESRPANRSFPVRVTEALGICLKYGPSHSVTADGKRLSFPANALCVRAPGCVWSSDATGLVGFLSIDIGASLLPPGLALAPMAFAPPAAVPGILSCARELGALAEPEILDVVDSLIDSLAEAGLVRVEQRDESVMPRAASRARELLEAALVDPPSLAALAAELGTNRFALTRVFKRRFGVAPHAFVVRLRVERARELIAQGRHVIDVALDLGFADQAHFCRCFKRVLGITPGQYARLTRTRQASLERTFVQDP